LNRGYGHPSYAGTLDLYTTAEGIVIVNELPLEKYLCGVVPSEMPSSYEKEALKAQAVCARSFAYRHLDSYAYEEYEAHMDDSTSFQVYGNSKPAESSTEAVKETKGQMLWYEDSIIQAYYYSTSCGKTASAAVWGSKMQKKCPYLKSVSVSDGEEDYEKDLPWYRWSATISTSLLSDLLSQYAGKDLGTLESVEVTKRDEGGAAISLKVKGSQGSITVKTENKIRQALGGSGYEIQKNDGSTADSSDLLPSAFFEIEKDGDHYRITGGGFGHGIGMSQNGANEMAKAGKSYEEILTFFYSGVEVRGNN
jgi:stage II sporulation protein D